MVWLKKVCRRWVWIVIAFVLLIVVLVPPWNHHFSASDRDTELVRFEGWYCWGDEPQEITMHVMGDVCIWVTTQSRVDYHIWLAEFLLVFAAAAVCWIVARLRQPAAV